MSHAEVCPICHGTGKLETEDLNSSSVYSSFVTCHGCNGRGWITVSDAYICPMHPVIPWKRDPTPLEVIC